MPATKRPPIPIPLQVQVYFRDAWLCHVCRKPVIFHLALKHLAGLVQQRLPGAKLAYWDPTWRRDQAPLLDELAASIDHIEAFSRGGVHGLENFATICARCNARKSAIQRVVCYVKSALEGQGQAWRARSLGRLGICLCGIGARSDKFPVCHRAQVVGRA